MDEINQLLTKLQNSSKEVLKNIHKEIFKILNLENQNFLVNDRDYYSLHDFVQNEILDLDFNRKEKKFFQEIQYIIETECKSKLANRTSEEIQKSLIEQFQSLKKYREVDLTFDFKELARRIVKRYPISISYNELYTYFGSKENRIEDIIFNYNKNVIDSFIKLAPSLSDFITKNAKTQDKYNRVVEVCRSIFKKLEVKFNNTKDVEKKTELAKTVRLIKNFLKELENGIYDSFLDKDLTEEEIERFIFERIPALNNYINQDKDIYEILLGTKNHSRSYIVPDGMSVQIETTNKIIPTPAETQPKKLDENLKREEELNNFIETLCNTIYIELDKINPAFLSVCEIKPTDEFIIETAVNNLRYVSEEELDKIVNELNKRIHEHIKNKTIQ